MTAEPEARALLAVIDRLAESFPDKQRSVIEDVVTEEHGSLANNPIRDYIPVLVERAAKLRLTRSNKENPGPTLDTCIPGSQVRAPTLRILILHARPNTGTPVLDG